MSVKLLDYLNLAFAGYLCPECGKNYKAKSSLRRHIKLECSKKAAFLCPYCSYASKQKAPLLGHVRRKHEEMLKMFLDIYYNCEDSSPGPYVKDSYS